MATTSHPDSPLLLPRASGASLLPNFTDSWCFILFHVSLRRSKVLTPHIGSFQFPIEHGDTTLSGFPPALCCFCHPLTQLVNKHVLSTDYVLS